MPNLNESAIENYAIELFKSIGYEHIYAPDIGENERSSTEDVILQNKLRSAIYRINPHLQNSVKDEAIKTISRIQSVELTASNEAFYRLLVDGVKVSIHHTEGERGEIANLIDFDNIENNEFLVVNQYTITQNRHNRRPDILLFVNGIPLVVIELKNASSENATIQSAYRQLETYKSEISNLFVYNAISVISDGLEAKAGTITSDMSRFMAWKSKDGESEAKKTVSQLETLILGMLNKKTLLDLLRHFIIFEKTKKEDAKTSIITISTNKKLAAYHQYYAVNKAVERTISASSAGGDKKGGVVWHTQGSGKSLSMLFYTGKIVLKLNNPTVLIITDRNDLDDQLFDTFAGGKELLRQEPVQASSRDELKTLLKVASGGVIFTTIQKFAPDDGNVHEELSTRANIIVMCDEAHRTQYGFSAKIDKESGDIKYGFAKYLRDALPNATYLGFTGTPVEKNDKNTPAVFGDYVDIYDIAQAVEDGATVKIYYESRLAKVNISDDGKRLIKELDSELSEEELDANQKAKAKFTQIEALIGSKERLKNIAKDIVSHFEARCEVFDGKAMIVAMSRRIAVALYDEIVELRASWHSDELKEGAIKVVMTASANDGANMAKHHTTKQDRKTLADRMKDPSDPLKLVIVRDMWLTGFDAPCMHTLYIDKPMQGHNLMQAIARVNRVYKDKPGGLIVDYLGIASDLKSALGFYTESGGRGDPTLAQEQAVAMMEEKLEVVEAMYHGFDYKKYFSSDTAQKLSLILEAEEHILGLQGVEGESSVLASRSGLPRAKTPYIDGKKRYVNEVTALSLAFAIAIPHEKALEAREEVAFFQAVKSRLSKFDSTGSSRTNEELETTIRQVIDKALVSEQVVDIFDAAGIKKPDISILSDEFLLEIKGMEHKNIAIETLKKLLNDELKVRSKSNLVKSRTLMEMLENAIKKYQNKILTAAEVIEELIKISKEIVASDGEAKDLGLSSFEYAFYTAVANNESAKELMGKEKLRELAVVLYQRVRENASIDWTIKESVKAKLKVIIKRTLKQFGYPPDMEVLATETVLKQAEMIADELV